MSSARALFAHSFWRVYAALVRKFLLEAESRSVLESPKTWNFVLFQNTTSVLLVRYLSFRKIVCHVAHLERAPNLERIRTQRLR
jgi:hypothetical protein